jgi:hypothetical protein
MRSIAFLVSLVVAGLAHAQQVNRADPKSPPAAAPGRDEASQRKLDDAAVASQRKLADEGSREARLSGKGLCGASARDVEARERRRH